MSATIKARFSDPHGAQQSHAVHVEDALYGMVVFQQGEPHEVSVAAGVSPVNYLDVLNGVVRWGVESGVSPLAITRVVIGALARP